MQLDMGSEQDRHLWVTFNMKQGDAREVIIDKERDVRIADGSHVVKVRFEENKILDVLVDDVFVVYPLDLEKPPPSGT